MIKLFQMDTKYNPSEFEEKIYRMWEENGYFKPETNEGNKKEPFSILLPLPNANDPMHMGHALFTIQDILVRYHRMLGDPTLWLPGGDHAGIETQYVYEKHLAKEGKSRYDFDRETLYKMIEEFVEKNKDVNKVQMKRLGFSLDWSRYHYSLEPKIIETVLETFRKLYNDGLLYRAERLVNYCTKCGTAFSDLEVNHVEKDDLLYYIDYGIIQIATARPETIFADVAVAVHPTDKRYKSLIGKEATIPIINRKIPIIADENIKKDFGAGALKVTPAHDELDFEIGKKHHLPVIKSLNLSGRLINVTEKYTGLKVLKAREMIVADLKELGKIVKTEPLKHTVSVCYRCNTVIEPMLIPQWYVKTKPLAKPAIEAVKKGKTKILPKKRFEKMYFDWMNNILDWNISRQIVWGPRIPIWYCLDCNPQIEISFINKTGERISGNSQFLLKNYKFAEIQNGLQSLTAPVDSDFSLSPDACKTCGGNHILQETDTFDTWFLSGQWPLTTLGFPDSEDFKKFYPTSVLDTMWDILPFWVARMMMLSIYRAKNVPFKIVHLHARVVDKFGQKMSKSKNNVVNPMDLLEKYGADALRMSLIFGVAPASDIAMSEDKVRAMRNFANKIWNIGRFINMQENVVASASRRIGRLENKNVEQARPLQVNQKENKEILKKLDNLIKSVTLNLNKFRFDKAAESLYHFTWHEFADIYIENWKLKIENLKDDKEAIAEMYETINYVYETILKLLHPFMPFVTEAIWSKMPRKFNKPLIISSWPNQI